MRGRTLKTAKSQGERVFCAKFTKWDACKIELCQKLISGKAVNLLLLKFVNKRKKSTMYENDS